MQNVVENISGKKKTATKTDAALNKGHKLWHLAFDNTAQANIITVVSNGKILIVNNASSKLLGYSKKELLTKNWITIFNIKESSFKKMLQQRKVDGNSVATVTVFKKNGTSITCEITSTVFLNEDGKENAITTITDMSKNILLQKNIDTEKEKKISSDIAVAISKQKAIDIIKVKKVADDIAVAISKQKTIDIIKVKKVADDIALAKEKQKKIDTKKEKTTADNIILEFKKSETRLFKINEWIKDIAKTSYNVMWDWDIASGEIYVGDSIQEIFGYRVQNNTMYFRDFCKYLLPDEKKAVKEKIKKTIASTDIVWNDVYKFKRFDGTIAFTTSRASIVRDDNGKAIHMIGAIQDVSRFREMEKELEEQIIIHQEDSEKFLLAARLSFDVIWDWNIMTNEVFLGDGFEELFGYAVKNNRANMITDWLNNLHPDDKEQVVAELQACIKSQVTHWEHGYRVKRANGSIAKVYVRASIMRHADGKAYRMLGAMQDLSRQKELEEKLEQEILLREIQIAAAAADAKEMERADIGKELHDNINQLLGASKMYIDMAKRGGDNSAKYLSRSSEYTLTAIEEIRKLTKGLTTDIIKNIGLCDAIENIVRDTMEVNPVNILLTIDDFIENSVNEKFKLNIFRIIQEQLNNILKHAQATKVTIKMLQNKKAITLVINDNGSGFNAQKKQKGIGMANIISRIEAFHGAADFDSQPGQGCILTAIFPFTDKLLNKEKISG